MKKQFWKRAFNSLLWIALSVLLLAAFWFYHKSPNHQLVGKLISHIETKDSVVALTFDDGPFPEQTEEVLDLLDNHQVKATFFLNGDPMAKHLELAKNIAERGHQIGNHSYSHEIMLFRSNAWLKHEVDDVDSLIRDAGYTKEIFFRPPFGKKFVTLPYYLSQTNRMTITWDVDADSKGGSKEEIVERVLAQTRPGSIILMHVLISSRKASREALPEIIEELRKRGYRFVTVETLISGASQNPA